MPDVPSKEEMQKIQFANLVMMLSSTAMQCLGKTVNPVTNKTETDLDAAQAYIDIIEMLQAKTKDGCDENEKKMISDILATLQLNFVETKESQAATVNQQTADNTQQSAEEETEDNDN
ncbi:hypothetical protein BVX97_02090 [bacterium E08(2017)]|nr:hypothetical protein BVX97_02090 [bacterium E08(2017)]